MIQFDKITSDTKDRFIRHLHYDKPLTICIAAICQERSNDPKIVFCADRMIESNIKFEFVTKIYDYNPSCMIMIASTDALISDMIIRNAAKAMDSKSVPIHQTVQLLAKECEQLELNDREKNVLTKFGLTYPEFIAKSKEISDELLHTITDYLMTHKYRFMCEFLVFGFDATPRPHIYVVNQSGKYKPYGYLGFATVGSGTDFAFSEMTKHKYEPTLSLSESLIRVYSAKKVAEIAGGVGKETDLGVLHLHNEDGQGKIPSHWHVESDGIGILDEYVDKVQKSESTIYTETTQKLDKLFHAEDKKP